jgi:hypothetical protein
VAVLPLPPSEDGMAERSLYWDAEPEEPLYWDAGPDGALYEKTRL